MLNFLKNKVSEIANKSKESVLIAVGSSDHSIDFKSLDDYVTVAGTTYYQKELNKLRSKLISENNIKTYNGIPKSQLKYTTFEYPLMTLKAKFVKEPNNVHDKNAIMVLVDNIKVGYVPAYLLPLIHKQFKKINPSVILFGGRRMQIFNGESSLLETELKLILSIDDKHLPLKK